MLMFLHPCEKGKRAQSFPHEKGDPAEPIQVQQELPFLRGSSSLT